MRHTPWGFSLCLLLTLFLAACGVGGAITGSDSTGHDNTGSKAKVSVVQTCQEPNNSRDAGVNVTATVDCNKSTNDSHDTTAPAELTRTSGASTGRAWSP